jgi:ribosome-binding factor A
MEVLEKDKPDIRSALARRVRLRFMPALEFFRDDTLDRVDRINTIIKKIHDERDPSPDGTGGDAASGDAGGDTDG